MRELDDPARRARPEVPLLPGVETGVWGRVWGAATTTIIFQTYMQQLHYPVAILLQVYSLKSSTALEENKQSHWMD